MSSLEWRRHDPPLSVEVTSDSVPFKLGPIPNRWTWIHIQRMRSERVISEPKSFSAGPCETCLMDEENVTRGHTGHYWCTDCAVYYGPQAKETFLAARIYERDVATIKKGGMPAVDSPVVEDIQMYAVWDEFSDNKIGQLIGVDAYHVSRVRNRYRIPGRSRSPGQIPRKVFKVPSHLTYGSETLSVAEWAKKLGVAKNSLYGRLRNGWSVEDTLTKPMRSRRTE